MIHVIKNRIIVPILMGMLTDNDRKEFGYNVKHGARPSFIWNTQYRNSDGQIEWEELLAHNLLHDDGEEIILKAAFSEAYSVPVNYYIGLDDHVTIDETDTLSSLSGEPAVGGYARQAVASDETDFTLTLDSGNWQAKTKTVTFTPSGVDYPATRNMHFGDQASGTAGKLIASVALSQSRTVLDGDSLDTNLTIKLSE